MCSFIMVSFKVVIAIVLPCYFSNLIKCDELKAEFLAKNHARCENFSTDPFFDFKVAFGRPWRVYYAWEMELAHACIDLKFKKTTLRMVEKFYSEMARYLQTQPMWEAAKMMMTMGSHQMMLFLQFAPVGRFAAAANIIRDGNIARIKGVVPLGEFFMKMYRDGKYLFILDCKMGGATLSSRFNYPPNRAEIEAVAKEIGMDGDGAHACMHDQDAGELLDRMKSKT